VDEVANCNRIRKAILRSQFVTLKKGEHIKYRPYAFTEYGILELSSVLNSERSATASERFLFWNFARRLVLYDLRLMVNAILYALCWYVKGEGGSNF